MVDDLFGRQSSALAAINLDMVEARQKVQESPPIDAKGDPVKAGRWPLAARLTPKQSQHRMARLAADHQRAISRPLFIVRHDLQAERALIPGGRLILIGHEELNVVDLDDAKGFVVHDLISRMLRLDGRIEDDRRRGID